MNKKGFTLIELLAVIFILGIVSVIATTLVVRYISNTKIDSFAVEASNVIAGAKNAVQMSDLNKLDIGNDEESCKIGNRMCFTIDTLIELGVFKGNKEVYDGKVNIDISDKQNLKYKLYLEKKNEFNVVDSNVVDYSKNKDVINKGNFSGEEIEEYTICSCVEDKTKPVIEKFYIEEEGKEYLTKRDTKVYLNWLDEDVSQYCVTDVNNSNSCNWVDTNEKSVEVDYTFDSDGEKRLYAFIKDKNRNISEVSEARITVDTEAPTNSSIIINNGDMNTKSVEVTLNLSSSGATEMCVSNTTSCSSWETYATSKSWTLNNSTNERKTVYVWFRDAAGNVTDKYEDTIVLDNEAPTGNSVVINDSEYTTERVVTLTLTSTGATEMCLSNTNECETWEDYVESKSWTLTEGEGTKTVYVWYRDLSGNESEYVSDKITYDNGAPTLTVTTPTGTSSSSPTYVKASSYTVSGTATDSYGIESVTVNGTKVTLGANGAFSTNITLTEGVVTTVTVIATDKAGKTTTVTRYVSYDISAPTNSSIRINNNATYATSTSVTLNLSSTGAKEMCISNTTSCSSWVTYATSRSWPLTSGDGTKRVYAWFRDGAGNTTSSYVYDDIILDTGIPSVTASAVSNNTTAPKISINSNEAGTYCVNTSSTRTNMSNCTKTGSISANTSLTTSAFSSGGTYYVHVQDAAGNIGISTGVTLSNSNPFGEYLFNNPTTGLKTNSSSFGLYRYIGSTANNFVKLGNVIYRIVGITDGSQSGNGISSKQVKVVRYQGAGEYYWNGNAYSTNGWEYSDLFSYLQGYGALTNTNIIPNEWVSKIDSVKWYYGSISSPGGSDILGDRTVSVTSVVSAEKQNVTSNTYKISIPYFSDYLYAGGCSTNENQCLSWMFDNFDDERWTMTRAHQNYDGSYMIWMAQKNGWLYGTAETSVSIINYTPTFYLLPSVNYVSGTGTSGDPFIIS